MLAAATGVISYAAYKMQTARFGNIFDRLASEQTLAWIFPTLIAITGISIVGLFIFIGLYMFLGKD